MWLVAGIALLQQPAGVFEGLSDGDRVEVILKNKFSFTGICFQIPKDRQQLTIKLLGYRDVEGTITFQAHSVLRVVPLPPVAKGAQDEMLREIAEARDANKQAEEKRKKREAEAAEKRKAAEAKAKEDDEKEKEAGKKREAALNFYAQFPESDGWGPDTYNSIKTKTLSTPEEQLFYTNYALWQQGKRYAEGGETEETVEIEKKTTP